MIKDYQAGYYWIHDNFATEVKLSGSGILFTSPLPYGSYIQFDDIEDHIEIFPDIPIYREFERFFLFIPKTLLQGFDSSVTVVANIPIRYYVFEKNVNLCIPFHKRCYYSWWIRGDSGGTVKRFLMPINLKKFAIHLTNLTDSNFHNWAWWLLTGKDQITSVTEEVVEYQYVFFNPKAGALDEKIATREFDPWRYLQIEKIAGSTDVTAKKITMGVKLFL